MFHIVFDSQGAQLLNAAMDLDEALDGEIISIEDDYSVGPIQAIFAPDGLEERKKWWATILPDEAGSAMIFSDASHLKNILLRMQEEEFDQIWIWMAPNARDVSGYFWLIGQLASFSGRIYIISLNNLPFINEKGNIFYPNFLHEIPAREFVKAKKLARLVSPAEFETDPDEWLRLVSENKPLRLLEGGKKIIQRPEDHYDGALMGFLPPAFQKISRTTHQFLAKSPEKINEWFLRWRIQGLIVKGAAEQQGDMIRLPVQAADQVNG
jgi:hypothetical protein